MNSLLPGSHYLLDYALAMNQYRGLLQMGRFARMKELFPKEETARRVFLREPMKLRQKPVRCKACQSRFTIKLDELEQCLGCMFVGKDGQISSSFTLNGWIFKLTPGGILVSSVETPG